MALVSIIERGVWEPSQNSPCLAMESVSPYLASNFSITVMIQYAQSWTNNVRSRLFDSHDLREQRNRLHSSVATSIASIMQIYKITRPSVLSHTI